MRIGPLFDRVSSRPSSPATREGLFVGTSGYAFDAWHGPFYPKTLKKKDQLRYYAGKLTSVEINYTFRRDPSPAAIAAWLAQTPESFRITLKAHQRITHTRRLLDLDVMRDFVERARTLGPRLGAILFQLHPNMKYDRDRLQRFLDALPDGPRYAFEFRHPSWDAAGDAIRRRGAAVCLAEDDDAVVAPDREIDPGKFAYLRLRKTRYKPAELAAWSRRIGRARAAGAEVFAYLKHEDGGLGPKWGKRILSLVE